VRLKSSAGAVVLKEELTEKINKLKKQRNAIILAHNYQTGPVQDIADITGDSLGLSQEAAKTNADVIVFCGVLFMAETAAILSPDKTVLIADKNAGCPMSDMMTAQQLCELKTEHPQATVVCYVNSSAEVKAESDYCCTSSNAIEVVKAVPADEQIIFVPDCHLGQYVKELSGRDIVLWPGYCPTHMWFNEASVREARKRYPDAIVLMHPESSEDAKPLADELLSTGQMLRYAKQSEADEFIIATEVGIIHTLRKDCPDKKFYAVTERAVCENMKLITLEKILFSLENMEYEVTVPVETAKRARGSLDRMLSILPK